MKLNSNKFYLGFSVVFYFGYAHLAASVSNGGGLGIVSAASGNVGWLSEQVDTARKLTDKPFGVNIMLMCENIDEIAKLIAEKNVSSQRRQTIKNRIYCRNSC